MSEDKYRLDLETQNKQLMDLKKVLSKNSTDALYYSDQLEAIDVSIRSNNIKLNTRTKSSLFRKCWAVLYYTMILILIYFILVSIYVITFIYKLLYPPTHKN